MPKREIQDAVARLGAIDYLSMCAQGLELQADRLRAAKPPGPTGMQSSYEPGPDVWFALVTLHRSFRALDLAAKASATHGGEIESLAQKLPNREAIKRLRDVYEHFDDYFQFAGKLQKTEGERRDMHLPQVVVLSGPKGVTNVTVAIGDRPVDVFASIQVMIPVLRRALALLEGGVQS